MVREVGSEASGVARVRIGRIKLKAGGADLRVIERRELDAVGEFIMNWAGERVEDAPSAVLMIAWWPAVNGQNWNLPHSVDWITRDPDLPLNRLFQVSAAKIIDRSAVLEAQYRTLEQLGAIDPPDDAS